MQPVEPQCDVHPTVWARMAGATAETRSVQGDFTSANHVAGAHAFSRKHPLSCWLSTMLVIFAGGMLCNGLLGEPILAPLKNTPQLAVATIVWYLVFYTPFDIGYKAAKFLPVKIVCSGMKEVYRCVRLWPLIVRQIFFPRA